MLENGAADNLGIFGVHYVQAELTPDAAAEIEHLGYRALWISGSRGADLTVVRRMLDATENLVVATGVVNIWYAEAHAVAETYHRVEAAYPARFLLGIGAGHPELGADFRSPYRAMIDYLDVLDEYDVPKPRRLLA